MPVIKITDRLAAAALALEGRRTEYRDTVVRGLMLRVTVKGMRTWSLNYTRQADGRRRRMTYGSPPAIGVGDARGWAQHHLAQVAKGADPAAERSALRLQASSEITFEAMASQYLEQYAKPNKRSWAQDARRLARHINPQIGAMAAGIVDPIDVKAVRDRVYNRGSRVESNRVLSLLKSVYSWAVEERLVKTSPAQVIRRRHREAPRERVLDEAEIRTWWHGLVTAPISTLVRIALRLCLVTGQRIGTVCGARCEEIDLPQRVWNVPGARMKSGRDHTVPLSEMAVGLFAEAAALRSAHGPWVFPGPKGTPIGPGAASRAMRRSVYAGSRPAPAIDIVPATPHDLRRTAATGLARLGVSRDLIGRILGHAERGVIVTYDRHRYIPEMGRALDRWGSTVARIVGDAPLGDGAVVPIFQQS